MSGLIRKKEPWKTRLQLTELRDAVGYRGNGLRCPDEDGDLALMKCAELQKQFGCGSLAQFRIIIPRRPGSAVSRP